MRYNLSEIIELIKDRRTIYPEFYSDREVHQEQIEKVLNTAIWAPSHKLTQPWRYKVFRGEGKIRLGEFMNDLYRNNTPKAQQKEAKMNRNIHRPAKASAVIAICMERDVQERVPEIEEVMAVACSVQNMSLACTAYGLGAFWSTPKTIQTPEMKKFLGIAEKDKCLGLFYIGYPGEKWPKSRRKPLEYVTEWVEK